MGVAEVTYFIGGLILLAAVAIAIARFAPRTTDSVVLQEVAPNHAVALAGDYLDAAEDTRFGFPTGFFRVEGEPQSGRLVAREVVFTESNLIPIMKALIMIVPALATSVGGFIGGLFDQNGRGFGYFVGAAVGFLLGAFVLLYLAIPAIIIGVVEIGLRHLARSTIVAVAESDGGTGSRLHFELSGPSAWMVRRELARAFDPPRLPARFDPEIEIALTNEARPSGAP